MSTSGGSGGGCRRIGSRREEAARSLTRPRTAVVLGSGGVVGAAWMTGALHAVQQRLAVPVGDVDLIVGTSAGSALAAALRCGVTLDEMTALQRGEPVPALRDAGLDEVYVLAPMASLVPGRPSRAAERLERRVRRLITRSLLREAAALRACGTRVALLTPGPEDLAAMGANVMDPRRRQPVLEISLRTSAAALATADGYPQVA
jgi:hypothetical protein